MPKNLLNVDSCFNSAKKIWQGRTKVQIFGSNVSLGNSIKESLTNQPGHISQICDSNGNHYTNEQILTLSIRIAQNLEKIGIQQEDVVGICASNTDFLAPLVFGSLFCGAIISSLDTSFDKDGVKHIFSITKPKIMFCDGKIYQIVKESLVEIDPSILIYTMKNHLEGVARIDELIAPTGKEVHFILKPLKRGSSQTAAILCSSGTTGLPKGVCVSHETFINELSIKLPGGDTLLCFSSIYWVSGLNCILYGALTGCTRIITDQNFSPELFLKLIEQYEVNIVISPPSQMAMAIQCPDFKQRNLSSLKIYMCGGSTVPFSVVKHFFEYVKGCHMIVGYGLTELGGLCCYDIPSKPGEVGKLKPNFTAKIIDDNGKQLGIYEQGEICLKNNFTWAGYLNDAEATRRVYDQDGYIHTGDLGYFDENDSLFVVDRKKDILKYNNFHFFPSEIEQVIMEIPEVVEVCVCGIPDIVSTFLPSAAVVKVSGSSLTEEDIANHVAAKMAHFKNLHGGVYFLDSLPKTPSGKNIRIKITQIVESLSKQQKSL